MRVAGGLIYILNQYIQRFIKKRNGRRACLIFLRNEASGKVLEFIKSTSTIELIEYMIISDEGGSQSVSDINIK